MSQTRDSQFPSDQRAGGGSLEYLEIECTEKVGGDYYRQIIIDVLQDLDLFRVIAKLHVCIDPTVPVFVAAGVSKKAPQPVRLRDFASLNVREEDTIINIGDERDLAALLKILWERFGAGHVDQPDRFTVVLTITPPDAEGLEDLVIAHPGESISRDIIYALQVIAPEGFKVRRQYVAFDDRVNTGRESGNRTLNERCFYYVASEDTLPEDVVSKVVAGRFALMGVKM